MAVTHLHGNSAAITHGAQSTGTWALMSTAAHDPLMRHAPHGKAWPRESGSWFSQVAKAASYSFARIYRRVQDLLREYSPRTAVELLPDWESDWGAVTNGTIAQRQAAVVAKIFGLGDYPLAAPTLLAYAVSLGYADALLRTYKPLVAGDNVGRRTLSEAWRYRTDVVIYTQGAVIDAQLKAFLAPRQQAYGVLGVLDSWSKWNPYALNATITARGAFLTKLIPGYVITGDSNQVWWSPEGTMWTQLFPNAGYSGPILGGHELASTSSIGTIVLLCQGEVQFKTTAAGAFTRQTLTGTPVAMASVAQYNTHALVGNGGRIWWGASGAAPSFNLSTTGSGYTGQFNDICWSERWGFVAVGDSGEIQISGSYFAGTFVRQVTGTASYRRVISLPDSTLIITVAVDSVSNPNAYIKVLPAQSIAQGVAAGLFTIPLGSDILDMQLSSDGKTLIASGTQIMTSHDSGATWQSRLPAGLPAYGRLLIGPAANPIGLAFVIGSPITSLLRGSYNGIENAI